jgi:hypothetical protein
MLFNAQLIDVLFQPQRFLAAKVVSSVALRRVVAIWLATWLVLV